VAVRIRMKKMGRKHRPFYRICAMDIRAPRDGRVLEQLGTYDPLIPETDARAILKKERIQYWLGVGALPSDKVSVLIKKYGESGTHLAAQQAALDRLAQQRRRPEAPQQPMPGSPKPKKSDEAAPPARRSDSENIRAEADAKADKE
jgi:small subunit ribosomal protein S16